MRCPYGISTGLQGGLKPYYTILQIISVVYLTPNRRKWNITILWSVKLGKSRPVPQAWLGGSDLGWVPASGDQIHTMVLCTHQWIAELHLLSFIFLQVKQRWAERPSEVKKPLSLTNIVGCNFNISVHLQMSAVLIRARHDFPPPSSRVNQESWQQLQGLMWQLPTPSAQNPDISLLSNWERISFKAVWLLSLEKSY